MERQVYDGFSVVVPDGWTELEDDATFAEEGGDLPIRFARQGGGAGMVLVTVPLFDPEEQPGDDAAELAALALAWGARRGLSAPVASATQARRIGTMATAVYALRGQFVQIWFFSDGSSLLHATYVCAWDSQEDERAPREAIVASLRFA
ncbi:MAG: hypothetical protein ABJE95_05560 [Byssovorax sp.]